jgi:SAM-dependent methyltransferase
MIMASDNHEEIRAQVRDRYGKIAQETPGSSCATACCGASPDASLRLGYSPGELSAVPDGANLGLGCGNPQAIAALQPGETVVDLGSGGGIDCFLAARRVGPAGRVIGVDMTAEMVAKARGHAAGAGAANVEFRLGEIEHLPVADGTVDVILSNCVINLSPDKAQVFRDGFRVLKPGGRLAISDVVAVQALPPELREAAAALTGCVAGAATVAEVKAMLAAAGFHDIRVRVKPESRAVIRDWFPGSGAEEYIASATIEAVKPGAACCAPACCGDPPTT